MKLCWRLHVRHGRPEGYEEVAAHLAHSNRIRQAIPSAILSENAHYIPVQSQSVGHNAPEALSGADFGIMHSRFYLIPRETFQNWRGSKEITTRRFRPSVQDETPDVLEQVDFSAPRNLA